MAPRPWAASARSMFLSYIRRYTTLRLFAGISVITGAENQPIAPSRQPLRVLARPSVGCDREGSGRMLGCSGPLRTLRVCMDHRDRAATPTPLISPTVASHGEMWTMLMQMIPSADAIGQTECDASRAIGARTFVTSVAFTHAATLSWASGSRSEGWKTRAGKFLAKWTTCSPEPLAISRMTPVLGRTSQITSRMISRLRSAAGAYRRSSLISSRTPELRPQDGL